MRKRKKEHGGGKQGARSLSLVFKNNDSLFFTPTELCSTLDSRLRGGRREKEGRRNRSRISTDGAVGHLVRVTVYLTGSDPSSLCPPTQTPNIHCDDV